MTPFDRMPLFEQLHSAQTILITGIGGGYDVYAGLPLYFALVERGKTVHVANYSFTQLQQTDAKRVDRICYEVKAEVKSPANGYFPELFLAQWLEGQGLNGVVYALEASGPRRLAAAYSSLCSKLNVDTIIGIDGGTDGLLFGDEEDLGTPLQDYTSLAALGQVNVSRKYLGCIGYGIDEICHDHFLENVKQIDVRGGFLGKWMLEKGMREVEQYCSAVAYANERHPTSRSIINNAIVCAIEEKYGCGEISQRTRAKKLNVTEEMKEYWFFELGTVVGETYYYDLIKDLETVDEVAEAIRMKLPLVKEMRRRK